MENGGMEDILAVILGAEPMDPMPMRPGMHGKMEAKGGMSAEEVLMKIDKIIKCWKEGGPDMEEDREDSSDKDSDSSDKSMDKPMKEGNYEFQEGPEEREGEGEGKRKPFQKRR